jgi:hypothetical protein
MTAVLARNDFLRAPLLATAGPAGYKEWHHFVIHGRDVRILINFSLANEGSDADAVRLVPRVIVIAHDENWTGAIERFDERAVDVSADLGELTIGGNRMSVLPDEPTLRGPKPTAGGRPDQLALRTEAARRGLAAHQWPGAPHGG